MDSQKDSRNQHLLERMECMQADVVCICTWYLRAGCISSSSRRNMLDHGNPIALGEGLGGRLHWLYWPGSATNHEHGNHEAHMKDSVAPNSRLMSMCSVPVDQACVQNLELWAFDKASGPQVVCGETWPNHFVLHPKPRSLALEKQLPCHYIGIQFFSSFGRVCFEVKQNPRTDLNHILFPSEFPVLSESCPKFQSWGLWSLSKKGCGEVTLPWTHRPWWDAYAVWTAHAWYGSCGSPLCTASEKTRLCGSLFQQFKDKCWNLRWWLFSSFFCVVLVQQRNWQMLSKDPLQERMGF